MMKDASLRRTQELIGYLLVTVAILTPLAAWLTHLKICFTLGKFGFLIAGAIFFPIGIIHGVGSWFGFW